MLEAIFNEAIQTVTLTGLFQWDYGQKLYIKGIELPEAMEVHFSNNKEKEAIVMPAIKEGEHIVVDVPNVLLEKSLDITAWVYEVTAESGETLKTIILKVEPRIKPQDFISTNPDAEDLLAETINKINQNIADNAIFKNQITQQQNDFETEIKADQEAYHTQWEERVDGSIQEAQNATTQCYDAISALNLEIYDMDGGDPFTQPSEDVIDANGGYPA